jgi:hypothetical protein
MHLLVAEQKMNECLRPEPVISAGGSNRAKKSWISRADGRGGAQGRSAESACLQAVSGKWDPVLFHIFIRFSVAGSHRPHQVGRWPTKADINARMSVSRVWSTSLTGCRYGEPWPQIDMVSWPEVAAPR